MGAIPVPSAMKTASASGARWRTDVRQGPVKRTCAPTGSVNRYGEARPPGTRFRQISRSSSSGLEASEYGRMSVSPPTGRRHEMNCPGRNAIRGPRRKSERVSGACSTMRAICASYSTAMLGHDLVDGVARDDDHDLGAGLPAHRPAAEARAGRAPRGLVELVPVAVVRGGVRLA